MKMILKIVTVVVLLSTVIMASTAGPFNRNPAHRALQASDNFLWNIHDNKVISSAVSSDNLKLEVSCSPSTSIQILLAEQPTSNFFHWQTSSRRTSELDTVKGNTFTFPAHQATAILREMIAGDNLYITVDHYMYKIDSNGLDFAYNETCS